MGLDSTTADSVVFLDSDDLLAPRCLEERYSYLDRHPDVDIVVGRQAIVSSGGARWVNVHREDIADLDRFLDMAGRIDVPWVNGGVLIRTDRLLANNVRWRDEFHWDDVAFHFECLLAGMRPRAMEQGAVPDSYYRAHEEDRYGSVLLTPAGIRNAARMFSWMSVSLKKGGLSTEARLRALARSFFHFCVVQPIDKGNDLLAAELIAGAETDGLIDQGDALRMRAYRSARLTSRVSSRASAYATRIARRTWMRDFFPDSPSTFCTIVPDASRGVQ